jgi:hypothetical protein
MGLILQHRALILQHCALIRVSVLSHFCNTAVRNSFSGQNLILDYYSGRVGLKDRSESDFNSLQLKMMLAVTIDDGVDREVMRSSVLGPEKMPRLPR